MKIPGARTPPFQTDTFLDGKMSSPKYSSECFLGARHTGVYITLAPVRGILK